MSISGRLKNRIDKIASASMALQRLITRQPRERTFRMGILLADNGERIPVVIKDVNDIGARVEFVSRMELPSSVVIVEPTLKLHCRAHVIWQSSGVAGVQFDLTGAI
jgi:hypothetical protein